MRDDDGRRLDHATLEVLRLRAVDQVRAGAHPEEVAAALGLHRTTVYGWLARYRGGVAGRPVPGHPPKLSDAQLRRVYALIVGSDPRQLQFAFALWTQDMVRRECGVALSAVSVGRLRHRLGLPPQRPVWQAYQQDEETVRRWKDETVPAIRAEATETGATLYVADAAGIRSDDHAGTTWHRSARPQWWPAPAPAIRST